ncbi:hypothetical protein [Algibacter lectus]|uniref:Uncharacterized protein n=1 Tax=Algibacter lectus TaxID=221126 RepID=A0A090VBK8_9FLAO|nr:hypothetical protein [Algibacter lectus]MDO7136981.1 hypothetical protein [Algibacter lectus]MWW24544.1 hypothetical protein [Algibacter lectus]TDY62563.1 hypothetical protein DFQ06_2407 [Algibacter lectus]SFC98310.1 hypothetical protein SAMN04489722_104219 [Algibacter lectus]GAL62146.1 hypothetical protein JCM19300_2897 [Algibacter lectus]
MSINYANLYPVIALCLTHTFYTFLKLLHALNLASLNLSTRNPYGTNVKIQE